MRRVCGIGIVCQARQPGGRHPRERGGPIEGDGEVAREEAVQDAVGELDDLVGAGRDRRARDDLVDRVRHLGAALERERLAARILPDERAQQVDAPERAGQALRRRVRPEFGDRVDAVLVGVRHEPGDDLGIGVFAHPREQRRRGVVGDTAEVRRIFCAEVAVEHGRRETGGAVEV